MKTELRDISPTKKEIRIEIEPEEVRAVYNKVSQKYAKSAQVPGFRKGMAPLDVIRPRFKNEIHQDVIQELLAPKITESIREHDLTPLAEPEIHLDDPQNLKLNGSMPVSLHVHVEVMPEIPEPVYKGLEATRRIKPTEDKDIEYIIEEQRKQFSTLLPVEDRVSETGDTVIVDLEGTFVDEPNAEPIKVNDLHIKLGDELIEPSFTENLAGVKQDQVKEFTVSYPDDFTSPALAGKTVNYRATVKSVGVVEIPELDDEWVQSLDQGFESVEDLNKTLRKELDLMALAEADNHVRNELIAKLIENHQFEVPDALIDMQARNLLDNFGQDLARQGVDLSKVDQNFIEMAFKQMRTQAERDVRGAMLLEKVADLEDAQVSSEEVSEEIERMAHHYQTTPEQIRVSLSQQQGGEENIANSLRTRKAVEALIVNAKITDGEWVDNEKSVAETEQAEIVEPKDKKPRKKSSGKKSAAKTD